jgi:hypothetical protein
VKECKVKPGDFCAYVHRDMHGPTVIVAIVTRHDPRQRKVGLRTVPSGTPIYIDDYIPSPITCHWTDTLEPAPWPDEWRRFGPAPTGPPINPMVPTLDMIDDAESGRNPGR